jgi:hypothetical protein
MGLLGYCVLLADDPLSAPKRTPNCRFPPFVAACASGYAVPDMSSTAISGGTPHRSGSPLVPMPLVT